jgi:hypothetical protein
MDRKPIMLKSPNLILAGFGALDKMGEEAGNLEAKKALLVTDKGIIASGMSPATSPNSPRLPLFWASRWNACRSWRRSRASCGISICP